MGFLVSISTFRTNSKSIPWNVHSVQETYPNFLQRPMRVANTADDADIMQSQAAITIDY